MKCFVHDSASAVGTCRNCGRGLCRDCAVETTGGLACRDRCEAAVVETAQLVRRNVVAGRGAIVFQWVLFVITGLVTAFAAYNTALGIMDGDDLGDLFMGAVLTILMFVLCAAFGRAILAIRATRPRQP